MKQLSFILLIILLITSCKKKTTVTIQAQDYITGDGSAYAGREYAVAESWTPAFEEKSKIVASGFLDDNGYANFDLKMNNNRRYTMSVSQPSDICYGGLKQYSLKHDENNTVNFDYLKCGYVDIKSNNINCEDNQDEFRFRFYHSSNPDIYIYQGFGTLNEWHDQAIFGCHDYSNAEPFYRDVPNGQFTVEWEVVRASGTISGTEYFTVNENDTTTYVIEY